MKSSWRAEALAEAVAKVWMDVLSRYSLEYIRLMGIHRELLVHWIDYPATAKAYWEDIWSGLFVTISICCAIAHGIRSGTPVLVSVVFNVFHRGDVEMNLDWPCRLRGRAYWCVLHVANRAAVNEETPILQVFRVMMSFWYCISFFLDLIALVLILIPVIAFF